MKYNPHVCVIVDPYSTGKYIAPALISRNYKCIYIQSSKNLPHDLTASVRKDDFILHLVYDNNLNFILQQLSYYQVKLCIPGSESGVELADILVEKLNLPSNDIALSKARRDKFLMIEAVKKHGLQTAQQFKSSQFEGVESWIKALNSYPVVLKPIKSASGDNVFICKGIDEVRQAFKKIKESNNLFGESNPEVLAQSYIPGDEYIVNTVSYEGKHLVAEIWQVERVPQTTIYDKCTLVTPDNERYDALQESAFKVLNALGINHGAATTELKYNESGVLLIESGARLMGGAELSFSNEFFGYTQLSLMLEAYFEPKIFKSRISMQLEKETKYGMAVLLISNVEGQLQIDIDLAKELKEVETLYCFELDIHKQGQTLHKTIDLFTCPGTVYLLGDNKSKVLEDGKKIREIENSLYKKAIANNQQIIQFQQKSHTMYASMWSKEEPKSNASLLHENNESLVHEGESQNLNTF